MLLVASGIFYFTALTASQLVVPRFVDEELGGSEFAVGLTVGSLGISAALIRPLIGTLGDRRGRRFLLQAGTLIAAASFVIMVFADSVFLAVLSRLTLGLGEAGAWVGMAAASQDMVPAHRRAEAASYFSLAVWGGNAIGPIVGDYLDGRYGADSVWWAGVAGCVVAAMLAIGAPSVSNPAARRPKGFLHPVTVRPGLILFGGLMGFMSFGVFARLHAEDVGLDSVGLLFTTMAVAVVSLRVIGSRLPDRLGALQASRISLAAGVMGLLILFGWREPIGLYVAVPFLAVFQTFIFPALFAQVVNEAPEDERSHAVASFSFFFDSAGAVGGPLMGVLAGATSRASTFGFGALIHVVVIVAAPLLMRSHIARRAEAVPPAGPRP